MRLIIWKLVWKIVCKWKEIAIKYGLDEQEYECCEIQRNLCNYKNAMRKKGLWK